jgi:Protein of unknown function (DUF1571)
MAFKKLGLACWAVGILTAAAAGMAEAQVYNQPSAPAASPYTRPPAAYQQYPNQPAAEANQQYQVPPAGYPQPANQLPAGPQYPYQAQPAATYPQYSNQPPAGPQYPSQSPGYATQPAPYPNQPGAYGSQPVRQPALPPSAANRYNGVRSQSPGGATYPEAFRSSGAVLGGVRAAQFEQPLDGQPASQQAQPAGPTDSPGFRATEVSAAGSALPGALPADAAAAGQTPQEHPLMPALRWARQGLVDINKVQDYSCTLVKRERIDGTLGEHEYIFVKVRHQPFSVYTYFLGPPRVKGQEAIFVEGQNSGNLLAHGNGIKHRLIGTVSLKPTSPLAMSGNRYPITEMGMRRLLERLIEIGSNDVKYGECTVKWIQNAKINQRICTCIEVQHPVPRRNFLFHLARIYVDDELQLPIRYEAYEWPARQGDPPQLTEEYTFLNVKINNGFTDADFGTENASYGFK